MEWAPWEVGGGRWEVGGGAHKSTFQQSDKSSYCHYNVKRDAINSPLVPRNNNNNSNNNNSNNNNSNNNMSQLAQQQQQQQQQQVQHYPWR